MWTGVDVSCETASNEEDRQTKLYSFLHERYQTVTTVTNSTQLVFHTPRKLFFSFINLFSNLDSKPRSLTTFSLALLCPAFGLQYWIHLKCHKLRRWKPSGADLKTHTESVTWRGGASFQTFSKDPKAAKTHRQGKPWKSSHEFCKLHFKCSWVIVSMESNLPLSADTAPLQPVPWKNPFCV